MEKRYVFNIVKLLPNSFNINITKSLISEYINYPIIQSMIESNNLCIDSNISEHIIKESLQNGIRIGKGNGSIDVINETIEIDVGCMCLNDNISNEKSIIQNFKSGGANLDTLFNTKNDKEAIEIYKKDLQNKYRKVLPNNLINNKSKLLEYCNLWNIDYPKDKDGKCIRLVKNIKEELINKINTKILDSPKKEKYYFLFISLKDRVYLCILQLDIDKIQDIQSIGFSKTGKCIGTEGFIDPSIGKVDLYKEKKRFELRLFKNIL